MTTKTNREFATHLVNIEVNRLSGGVVCLADLPDTCALCNGLDDLEAIISESNEFSAMSIRKAEIRKVAQGIACELLEEEGFPFHI